MALWAYILLNLEVACAGVKGDAEPEFAWLGFARFATENRWVEGSRRTELHYWGRSERFRCDDGSQKVTR